MLFKQKSTLTTLQKYKPPEEIVSSINTTENKIKLWHAKINTLGSAYRDSENTSAVLVTVNII